MEKISFSIIIVTYNSLNTLVRAVDSVLCQTYDKYELVIIDGDSNDGTKDYLQTLNDSHLKWISEKDNGIYNAMNKGVDIAEGKYIQFIGADDWLYDKYVLQNVADEIKDVDVYSSCIYMVNNRFNLVKYGSNKVAVDKSNYNGDMIPHPGMYIKSKLVKEIKFIESYKSAADYNLFLSLYLNNEIRWQFSSRVTVMFSLGGISSQELIGINEHLEIMKRHSLPDWMIARVMVYRKNLANKTIKAKLKSLLIKFAPMYYLYCRLTGWRRIDSV